MTQKSSTMQSSDTKLKPKLLNTKSLPLVTSAKPQKQVITKKLSQQVLPSDPGKTSWRDIKFPKEECIMNNTPIITYQSKVAVPEPYQVPIVTRTQCATLPSQINKTKKVALLPKPGGTLKNWSSFVKTGKPVPPPKLVAKRTEPEQRTKLSKDKRRDLAYLVVDLTKRERKTSVDDLDAELDRKYLGEERNSISRSRTVSAARRSKYKQDDTNRGTEDTMNVPGIRLSSDSSPRHSLALPSSFVSNNRLYLLDKRTSLSSKASTTDSSEVTTDSANLSDLSSDAFVSSAESDSKTSTKRAKVPRPYSEHKKRRAPPPPPATSQVSAAESVPPSTRNLRVNPMTDSRDRSLSYTGRRGTAERHGSLAKSSSGSQLRGVKPARPPPPTNKPKAPLREARSSPQGLQAAKGRPSISTPKLISTTKRIPENPVSGPFRTLPSPPPTPTTLSKERLSSDDFADDQPDPRYEDIDFNPTPVAPPRKKRTKSKSLDVGNKPLLSQTSLKALYSKSSPPVQRKLGVESRLAGLRLSPELKEQPQDYLEPVKLSGEALDEEDDEQCGDYVYMASDGVEMSDKARELFGKDAKAESDDDLPDDSYVDMQPGQWHLPPAPKEEPIYVEMAPNNFVKPRESQEKESLYYACQDLFAKRPDLTVKESKKKNAKKTKKSKR